ncbi:transcriptional regulator [[Pantoea] beijingensis]|uniref:Transcriptional regulator n=1 Tax=[Pantoea] beijingensis TaxID=1324864 RepID=A0A443IAS6_9GAMM|nr:LysR family transcriptional regulator [[Pantoea] beijingensis]RWR01242.1 transcriptional regulator [[Pantoea] beijingensis]
MDINQLRCFVAVGNELHFGRAAQKMEMMPASLSRFIRLLEEDLGIRLLNRSTRNVSLTIEGAELFDDVVKLLAQFDELAARFKSVRRGERRTLRIGAIDSAARGLLPQLLNIFVQTHPHEDIHITEDKTVNLIPRLKSGWLDMIFIRPPKIIDSDLCMRFITRESCVLALPTSHSLAGRKSVNVNDFKQENMILPERRTRPHSHDLIINIFKSVESSPRIAQFAEEKQTILSFVAAGLGLAIVPASFRNMNSEGVAYINLMVDKRIKGLPLSIAWHKGNDDPAVLSMLDIFYKNKAILTSDL